MKVINMPIIHQIEEKSSDSQKQLLKPLHVYKYYLINQYEW